jgi:glycosyltransferase involved in cell wall biosynthesis
MKICFIVGTLGRGGAERQLLYMLKALKSCEVEIRILCLTKGEAYEKDIKSLGIPIEWVGEQQNRVLRLLKILNNIRKNPVDILQSSHFYTNIYVGIVGKILNVPTIGAIRNDLISEISSHKFLGEWQVSLPKYLIANSKLAYKRAIEKGISPDKINFVQNVVEQINTQPKQIKETNPAVRILFVGRLVKQKRPEKFIKLASILIRNHPEINLKFQIAGDGQLRHKLEKIANDLNLSSEKIEFLGICSKMETIYQNTDILISTSEHEGTSNVILEAMSFGIAVIATKVGGTPEIVTTETGILVDPDNEEDLIKASDKLVLNDKLRTELGRNGREFVKQNHSIESLREHLMRIYKGLL